MSDNAERPVVPAAVLLVDDKPEMIELLQAYLEVLPEVTTDVATNGVEALEKVASRRPDLILLDVMMPKMSGFEVCNHLKKDPATRDVPIVMLTALNEQSDIARAGECGADDYLVKPVNRDELIKRVSSLLRLRQLKSDLSKTMNFIDRVTDPPGDA